MTERVVFPSPKASERFFRQAKKKFREEVALAGNKVFYTGNSRDFEIFANEYLSNRRGAGNFERS